MPESSPLSPSRDQKNVTPIISFKKQGETDVIHFHDLTVFPLIRQQKIQGEFLFTFPIRLLDCALINVCFNPFISFEMDENGSCHCRMQM
jgi:hypothetical protein